MSTTYCRTILTRRCCRARWDLTPCWEPTSGRARLVRCLPFCTDLLERLQQRGRRARVVRRRDGCLSLVAVWVRCHVRSRLRPHRLVRRSERVLLSSGSSFAHIVPLGCSSLPVRSYPLRL